ncbi:hypothetical protein L3X38_016928 [Prunus dulcis]|uniref:Uncharacterized protein n=1 Tax=Prunus dulcis TaxID=3755 RepID=A0AAD4Z8P4_PRUDU|nr:hypothetical protein L3X38_016928 [Prunus dulcis]
MVVRQSFVVAFSTGGTKRDVRPLWGTNRKLPIYWRSGNISWLNSVLPNGRMICSVRKVVPRLEQVSAPLTMQRDSHIWFRRWLLPQSRKSCRARGRTVKAYDLNVCGVQHSPFSLWNDELRGLPLGIEMEHSWCSNMGLPNGNLGDANCKGAEGH